MMKAESISVGCDDRFLRMPEVRKTTGLSRAHVYYLANKGEFPKPYKIGEKASAWLLSEVMSWMNSRIAETRSTRSGNLQKDS